MTKERCEIIFRKIKLALLGRFYRSRRDFFLFFLTHLFLWATLYSARVVEKTWILLQLIYFFTKCHNEIYANKFLHSRHKSYNNLHIKYILNFVLNYYYYKIQIIKFLQIFNLNHCWKSKILQLFAHAIFEFFFVCFIFVTNN